eukprot:58136_1
MSCWSRFTIFTIFVTVLFYHSNSQFEIQGWECGEIREFSKNITEFTGSNTIEFCTGGQPKFGRFGTIWLLQQEFQTTDVYKYVYEEGGSGNCITFDLSDSRLSYWHDCYKYTGDPTQLSDTFTIGSGSSGIDVTISNNCDITTKECASAVVECGSTLKLTNRLLNENVGVCDISTAPLYGTIGVFDNDIDDWMTRDLHSFVSSSGDTCLGYWDSHWGNYELYYIHNCESFTSSESSDIFQLGALPGYQISVTVNNECVGNNHATNCIDPTSLTNMTQQTLISSDCNDIAVSPGGERTYAQYNTASNQYNLAYTNTNNDILFVAKDNDLSDILNIATSSNDNSKSDLAIVSTMSTNKIIMMWSELYHIKYARFDVDSTNIGTIYQADNSSNVNNMYPVMSALPYGNVAIAWFHIPYSSTQTREIRAVIIDMYPDPVISSVIQVASITSVASDLQITSIPGEFMIAWSDMHSLTGNINHFARIYTVFGETNTDIFTLSYDLTANIYGLSTSFFFVVTQCSNFGVNSCIQLYDEIGNVKTINGKNYFQCGAGRNWIGGSTIAELSDENVLVLYENEAILMDVFHIDVTDIDNIVINQQSKELQVLSMGMGISELVFIASSDTIYFQQQE